MSVSRLGFRASLVSAALALAAGCAQSNVNGVSVTTAGSTSGAAKGSASGTTEGLASSGGSNSPSSSSGSTGAGSGGGSSGTSGGTSGGNSSLFLDGGYVVCRMSGAPDAGPKGDGGPAAWLCAPGTYFCDFSGNLGNCFQCLADGDCTNQALPTYDPLRPRCDLHSGQAGYQGFCQACLADADCAGNSQGSFCDLDPPFPAGSLDPPFDTLGFEACGKQETDCRFDGGPSCDGIDQFCEPDSGQCARRDGTCQTDQDCESYSYSNLPYQAVPYCVQGRCERCQGNCPAGSCQSDSDCGNPTGSAAGASCDLQTSSCVCTGSSQCNGIFPSCLGLDAGQVNAGGQPIGSCGCGSNADCADAGLVCYSPSQYCATPCTTPGFPPCSVYTQESAHLAPRQPICDPGTGFCRSCLSDQECQTGVQTGGPTCLDGYCTCAVDADCPGGETCQLQDVGPPSCAPALAECTPASCPSGFCDWDSGACTSAFGCLIDSDCPPAEFCSLGSCVGCRDSSDCVNSGAAANGSSWCCVSTTQCRFPGQCIPGCNSDQDCIGNAGGPACVKYQGRGLCVCGTDQDCAASGAGHRCVTDAGDSRQGQCSCASAADCGSGSTCQRGSAVWGACRGCQADRDCPSGTFCDPREQCRPRCDEGHSCQGSEAACDTANSGGLNGKAVGGSAPGVEWCFECLSPGDCPAEQACVLFSCGFSCNASGGNGECRPGETCVARGSATACEPSCDAGACPVGEACDALDVLGDGANVCYQCVTVADCPDDKGCNDVTHECGSCLGGDSPRGQFDCAPGDICSNYWVGQPAGVCLQSCDLRSCPADRPLCSVIPSLTTEHRYCINCLQDADCADGGPGAWCDSSVNRTFTCQPPPT